MQTGPRSEHIRAWSEHIRPRSGQIPAGGGELGGGGVVVRARYEQIPGCGSRLQGIVRR